MQRTMNFRLVSETVRQNAIAAISAIEIDRQNPMMVRIEDEKKTRTARQNAYLWGVVYKFLVDNDTGFFFNEANEQIIREHRLRRDEIVHEFCKQHFLMPIALDIGDGVIVQPSTAKLSRKAFVDYVESIARFAAAELGVYIPLPEYSGFDELAVRAIENAPIEAVIVDAYNEGDLITGVHHED